MEEKSHKVCHFFRTKGFCKNGENCAFIHTQTNYENSANQNKFNNNRKPNKSYPQKGGQRICSFYQTQQGCKNQENCTYLHVEKNVQSELDEQNQASQDKQQQNENYDNQQNDEQLHEVQDNLQDLQINQNQQIDQDNEQEKKSEEQTQIKQIQNKEEIQQLQNQRWDNLEDDDDDEEEDEEEEQNVQNYNNKDSDNDNKGDEESEQRQQKTYNPRYQKNYEQRHNNNYNNNRNNYKKPQCTFHLRGACLKGASCQFSHDDSQQQQQQQPYQRQYNNFNANKNYHHHQKIRKFAPTCVYYLQNSCLKEDKCDLYHPQFQQYTIDPNEFYFDIDDLKRTNSIDNDEIRYLNYQINDINHTFDPNNNCFLIRHGLSNYNYIGDRFVYETGKYFLDKSSQQFQVNEQLIDAELHYIGVQQSQNIGKELTKFEDIEVVFVSPLQRTLQTCYEVFKDHPNYLNKKLKIIVLPQLMEILSKVQDISNSLHKKLKQKYSELGFDFSMFSEDSQMNGEDWQLQVIKDEEVRQQISKQIEQEKAKWEKICIRAIKQNFPKAVESNESVLQRSQEVISYIQNYVSQNNLEDKKIAIITHARIIKNILMEKQQHEKFYEYKQSVGNCQIISLNL